MNSHIDGMSCLYCGELEPLERRFIGCGECRNDEFAANFQVHYSDELLEGRSHPDAIEESQPGVFTYHRFLPVNISDAVSLGEGQTPLIQANALGELYDIEHLYIKDESQNPTWSFKDRHVAVAVSDAVQAGADVVTIASTGNHGVSTAAYAARAGLTGVIFTVSDIPETMKRLLTSYGAEVFRTPTKRDRWKAMRSGIEQAGWYPISNYTEPPIGSNFIGTEGYKTLAFEICHDLGWEAPDWVVQPTAWADGLWGVWRGFSELHDAGVIEDPPQMVAASPNDPFRTMDESDELRSVSRSDTLAFSIGSNAPTYQGIIALRESNGESFPITNEGLLSARQRMATSTGLFGELASVAPLAVLGDLREHEEFADNDTVVCINTSSGMKDMMFDDGTGSEIRDLNPTAENVVKRVERSKNTF